MSRRILITGANRGLGLEMVRQLAERVLRPRSAGTRGTRIFATCRQPAAAHELQALAAAHPSVNVLPLDVADVDSRAALVAELSEHCDGLDWLVNNAAINLQAGNLDALEEAALAEMFRVNSIAPLLLSLELLPLLRAGETPRVVHISSGAGSLENAARSLSNLGYSASKAALNMIMRKQANAWREEGIIVFALGPGWVRTDMGGASADISVEESIAGCLRVIDALTMAYSGGFGNYTGAELPW